MHPTIPFITDSTAGLRSGNPRRMESGLPGNCIRPEFIECTVHMKPEIYNSHCWIRQTDPSILRGLLEELLEESGFHILEVCEHHFQPCGYTALFLLSTSHLAVHTFPEAQCSYLEMSSCGESLFLDFIARLREHADFIPDLQPPEL